MHASTTVPPRKERKCEKMLAPVKKTDLPVRTADTTVRCSLLSATSAAARSVRPGADLNSVDDDEDEGGCGGGGFWKCDMRNEDEPKAKSSGKLHADIAGAGSKGKPLLLPPSPPPPVASRITPPNAGRAYLDILMFVLF